MPNRLVNETSPYLLQHAHNPVDWFPWGTEALQKAKTEDKPIFLSIGYAACHWCHVMAHESFENGETAALLNESFVAIKVDREERPDLDSIYMGAVVAMTGQGGWPMSVFLTPDGKPFYAGTYFPNVRRYGMPAFNDVLRAVADAWKTRREELITGADHLIEVLQRDDLPSGGTPLDIHTLDLAVQVVEEGFDHTNGGWGTAPKFPQPMLLEFLLRSYLRTGDQTVLRMVTITLDHMGRGGIYDQLGGGFHRYSTDAIWLVPHFEKMLYDNAQLARVYLHAWQITQDNFYRRIAEQTLDYVAREMTHPAGGFFSTQDADSEGEEGKFFIWTPQEIQAILAADAQLFMDAYGVTPTGNFEGYTILHMARSVDDLADMHMLSIAETQTRLHKARRKLFAAREQRVKPARDEKVLAAWNGLMLATFAEAARVLGRDDYRVMAERNAAFVLGALRDANGQLYRSWKDGKPHLNGYLEDYAHLAEGLLTLYETTFNEDWFIAASELADAMLEHFGDPAGGFFDTGDDHEALVIRPKEVQDNATPSGNAMAVTVLLKLAAFTGHRQYADAADAALRRMQQVLPAAPTAFAQWLCALDFAVGRAKEIAIIGEGADAQRLLAVIRQQYRPNQVVAVAPDGHASGVPLLHGRAQVNRQATAYVCQNFVCRLPVTDANALAQQLAE